MFAKGFFENRARAAQEDAQLANNPVLSKKLAATALALLLCIVSMAFLVGSVSAMPSQPGHANRLPIGDPCWDCITPTPTKQSFNQLPLDSSDDGQVAVPLAQFTSRGHILGFRSDAFMLSNATYALRVAFVGANNVKPTFETPAQTRNDAAPPLTRVEYPNLWDDITLAYDAPAGGIVRSTYTLAPFASVESIRLQYNAPVTISADGSLSIAYETGRVNESAPIAWQEINGRRVGIPVAFVLRGERQVGFAVGEHDPHVSLIIDPVLTWNTFLGSEGFDASGGIALDASGNTYVTGVSSAAWGGGECAGCPIRAFTQSDDAFVAKLDAGGALSWNTFLGGTGYDYGGDIVVDGSGNVYVAGNSTSTWGAPVRAYTPGADYDAFAAKLDSSGALTWNTFLGGSGGEGSGGIAVDGSGNVHVSGTSGAAWGAGECPGCPIRAFTASGNDDAFAAKLDSKGALTWNTFLGASAVDNARGIAVDPSGNVHLVGISGGTWGAGECASCPIRAFSPGGNDDAFVVKLDSTGALTWNTFLGGSGVDWGAGIAVDGSGNVFVAGISGFTWGNPVRPYAGLNDDAFAAKLDSGGTLAWNTFLGGNGVDHSGAIAVNGSGNIYVAGTSTESWATPVRAFTRFDDAFAAQINSAGALIGNTFLGSYEDDSAGGIASDGNGNLYIAGTSHALWGDPLRAYSSGYDGFVANVSDNLNCAPKPEAPSLLEPGNGEKVQGRKVIFDWSDAACTATFTLLVKAGSSKGTTVLKQTGLTDSQTWRRLKKGGYYWRVIAINAFGKSKSVWYSFKVK